MSDLPDVRPEVSLDEYLRIKSQIDLLQARLDALKPAVVESLSVQGGRMQHAGYEFCVRSRVVYDYSEAVAEAERRCRDLKRAEEQNGTATVRSFSEFPYVRAL
jgi:hypothetical protein